MTTALFEFYIFDITFFPIVISPFLLNNTRVTAKMNQKSKGAVVNTFVIAIPNTLKTVRLMFVKNAWEIAPSHILCVWQVSGSIQLV